MSGGKSMLVVMRRGIMLLLLGLLAQQLVLAELLGPALSPRTISKLGRMHDVLSESRSRVLGPLPPAIHELELDLPSVHRLPVHRLRGGRRTMRDDDEGSIDDESGHDESSYDEDDEDDEDEDQDEGSSSGTSADSYSGSESDSDSGKSDVELDPMDEAESQDEDMPESPPRKQRRLKASSRRDELPQATQTMDDGTLTSQAGHVPELRDAAAATVNTLTLDAPHHLLNVEGGLQSMRKAGVLTDVVLVCKGGAKLLAHRIVLAAASSKLRALVETASPAGAAADAGGDGKTPTKAARGAKSGASGSGAEVAMEDVEEGCASVLLDFIYTGHVDVGEDQLPALLGASNRLGVTGLRDACAQHLLKEMDPDNALRVRALGKSLKAHDLYEAAHHLCMEEFLHVSNSNSFLELDEETLSELIASDDLLVNSEKDVLDAVVRWIESKEAERCAALLRLLGLVRLGLLPLETLAKKVAACGVIQRHLAANPDWQAMLNRAVAYVGSSAEARAGMQSEQTRERLGSKGRFLVCVGGRKGSSTRCLRRAWMLDRYQLNSILGARFPQFYSSLSVPRRINYEWFEVASLHTPRKQVAAAEANGKVYVAGGWDGSKYQRSVEMYDTSKSDWIQAPSMAYARGSFGLAGLDNGDLLAAGGFDGHEHLASAEIFSAQHQNWTAMPPLKVARSGLRIAVVGGKVLAVGGFDGSAVLNTVEEWDAAAGVWRERAGLLSPRRDHAMCVLGGTLYVAGGFNGTHDLASVEMFDPGSNQWHPVASMLKCRSGLSLTLLNNKLHALGGYDGDRYLAVSEAFDPIANEWCLAPEASLPTRMAHFGSALL